MSVLTRKDNEFLVIRAIFLFVLILSFGLTEAVAPLTPASLREQVRAIQDQYSQAPLESIEKLNNLQDVAKENEWEDVELFIAGEIVDIYLLLGREQDAELIVNHYQEQVEQSGHGETLYTFKKAELQIADIAHKKDRALVLINELLSLGYLKENPRYLAAAYLAVAQSYLNFYELKSSLEYLKLALDKFEDVGDKRGASIAQSSIAEIYQRLEEYDTAIDYHTKALAISEELGDKFNISIVTFNIGNIYFRQQNFKLAKQYLVKALAMSKEFNDEVGVAYASRLLGEMSRDSNPDLAYNYYKEAESLFKKHGQEAMVFASRNALIELLGIMERWEEAEPLIALQRDSFNGLKTNSSLLSFQATLFEYGKRKGDYKLATEAATSYIELMKANYKKEKDDAVQKLIIQYDSEKKNAENILLKKNNELKELRLAEQEKQSTILFLSFAFVSMLVLFVGYLLFKQLKIQQRFRELALRDELTGAPNRRSILKYASKYYEKIAKTGDSLSIAIIDIDHFKQFNDKYGHDVGDQVLIAMAEACRNNIRRDDFFGRYGGEEWMLVLPNASISDVKGVYDRLSDYLNNVKIDGAPEDIPITFSMGVACANDTSDGLDAIIKDADDKMYQAKEQGRARMVA